MKWRPKSPRRQPKKQAANGGLSNEIKKFHSFFLGAAQAQSPPPGGGWCAIEFKNKSIPPPGGGDWATLVALVFFLFHSFFLPRTLLGLTSTAGSAPNKIKKLRRKLGDPSRIIFFSKRFNKIKKFIFLSNQSFFE